MIMKIIFIVIREGCHDLLLLYALLFSMAHKFKCHPGHRTLNRHNKTFRRRIGHVSEGLTYVQFTT